MTSRKMDADVAVVGLGAMGSMTAWQAAARGASVIAIEQFSPGHDRGSSHGGSRIFREIIFEGPEYVPIAKAAHGLWRVLERESATSLLIQTGGLAIGAAEGSLIREARASAEAGGVDYELLDNARLRALYPQHAAFDDDVAVYERGAGVLLPEEAIRTAIELAASMGAEIFAGTRVLGLTAAEGGVEIRTDQATIRAKRAVVSTGAWFTDLVPQLHLPLRIRRSCLAWFVPAAGGSGFGPERFPVFVRESGHLDCWGIPDIDGRGVKVGAGASVDKRWLARPEDNWYAPEEVDLAPIEAFVGDAFPDLRPTASEAAACMNSKTPDEDFIIGVPEAMPQLVLLGGFSGHGFKHSAGIGRIAAELALDGGTEIPLRRFSPDRFTAVASTAQR